MSSAAAARNPAAAPTLADCPRLFHAADGFIRGNTNFESSIAINMVVDEAATCTGYSELFQTPLRHKLFTVDAALRWALFLSVSGARAIEEGDAPFAPTAPFNVAAALTLIGQIYDVGLQEIAWDHFEADEDLSGSGDEEAAQ
jgi:hypothetical protein